MTWLETQTEESKKVPGIFITVYRDKSGGFFSKADLKPVALVELVEDPITREALNVEYELLLKWTHMRKV